MQAVKLSKKVKTKQEPELREMLGLCVEEAENYGNLPMPLLLKIRRGILFVPVLYTITEGVARGMKQSIKIMSEDMKVFRAIL